MLLFIKEMSEKARKLKLNSLRAILEAMFENTQDSIMITDANKRIVSVNPAFTVITGYKAEEVIGKNPRLLQSGRHDAEFYLKFWTMLNRTGNWQGEIWNRRKNGEIYPEWLTISAIKDDDEISNYVAIFSDITSIKLAENRYAHMAQHDPLTGLPNRMLFYDHLKLAIAQARRYEKMVGILFIDLDKFKPVNDNYGHRVGDILLQRVADKLRNSVREGDTVARMGGDEFTVVLVDIADMQDAAKVAVKILSSLKEEFLIEGRRLFIGASIGISLYPFDGVNVDALVRNADSAMYRAKKIGGNSYHFFVG